MPRPLTTTAPQAGDGRSQWIDPSTLMRIKSLQLRARIVVEGFLGGLHRSPYHGFSVEFTEYRQFTPGDDPRHIDWRLYARSDRMYIKRFEDETNLRCYLLVDLSRSMGYTSGEYSKAEYAKTCAATLAYFLSTQRDAVGLATFDEQVDEWVPARHRPGHLHRLLRCLERGEAGAETRLGPPLEQLAQRVRRRGVVVLISDLLAPLDGLEQQLANLRAMGHELIVLRVLDPAERTLPFESPALYRDLETGRELYVDPAAARQQYLRRFGEHERELQRVCGTLGVDMLPCDTNHPLELTLFDFLRLRQGRGRFVRRRGASGGGR